MRENTIALSDDGREATVTSPDHPGWIVHLRSQRPDGFRFEDLVTARTWQPPENLVPGQRNHVRRREVGPFVVYLHLLTGPPTWWLPLVSLKRGVRRQVMVGWLRCAVAVAVIRKETDSDSRS